jgi:hypothetical protein
MRVDRSTADQPRVAALRHLVAGLCQLYRLVHWYGCGGVTPGRGTVDAQPVKRALGRQDTGGA